MKTYDLMSLLAEHGHAARVVSNGSELLLACPLCADHKSRMFINRRTYLWTCHNCGEYGNLYRLLEVVLELDPIDVYRVAKNLDDRYSLVKVAEKSEITEVELPPTVPLRNPSSIIERPFWDYLLGPTRKLSIQDVLHYDIQACLTGRYAMRVIIPVRQAGRLVSFVARSIYDSCSVCVALAESYYAVPDQCTHRFIKVLYPLGTERSRILFNIDNVVGREDVVLVEGAFDAIRLRDRAVASLGSSLSPEQRALLRSYGIKKVHLLYDTDEAGRKATRKVARELIASGLDVTIIRLPAGVDPASATRSELDNAFREQVEVEDLSCNTTLRRLV